MLEEIDRERNWRGVKKERGRERKQINLAIKYYNYKRDIQYNYKSVSSVVFMVFGNRRDNKEEREIREREIKQKKKRE